MKTLNLFVLVSIVFVLLVCGFFVLLYSLFVHPGTNNPLDSPDKIQTLTSFLSLIFGTTAAIGGAFATIQAASLGRDISKRQELRDSTAFLDEISLNSIKLFSNLIVCINSLYSAGVLLDVETTQHEHEIDISDPNIGDFIKKEVCIDIKNRMLLFSEKILRTRHKTTSVTSLFLGLNM